MYVAFIVMLGVAAGVFSFFFAGGLPDDRGALVVLVLFSMIGVVRREMVLQSTRITLSLGSIILLASAIIVGPLGSALVGLALAVIPSRGGRPIARAFNAGMYSINGSVAGLSYLFVSRGAHIDEMDTPGQLLIHVAAPLLVADVVVALSNALMLAIVLRLSSGTPIRAQVLALLSTTGLAYLAYGVIGFLFAVLWVPAHLGPASALLVMAPLLTARWALAQYVEEASAHNRTLSALVTALERKDPRTAGHGGRVAQLSDWIAQSMQLSERERAATRTAGMLHDLGRIAVPTRILRAQQPLSDDDLVLLAEHPHTAVEMLRGIEFLDESLSAIQHHHERFDGAGYPHGLAGREIPVGARIIAVADAFDALTTQRAYRRALTASEALAVLGGRAPQHLDPDVVDALGRAVARQTWEPTIFEDDDLRARPSVMDHDDVEASDALAARADLLERIRERYAGLRPQRVQA